MNPITVSLEHFQGEGLLLGVWFTEAKIDDSDYDLSSCVYFMLDGIIYVVRENPDDGYRSHLRDVVVNNSLMPVNVWSPPEPVFCTYIEKWEDSVTTDVTDDDYYRQEELALVEVVSTKTKKLVLTFGTSNTNDYYPSFVGVFHPENMGINERHADLFGIGESE